jgi:hypothetical protein
VGEYLLKRCLPLIIALAACLPTLGAEHHGFVRFAGLPVPGAAVTATQGDKRLFIITDQGARRSLFVSHFSSMACRRGLPPPSPPPTFFLTYYMLGTNVFV